MEPNAITIILGALLVPGVLFTLYSLYYLAVALCGFGKGKAAPAAKPATRFAVLVAARNEQAVIGNLVDSLKAQHYPREMYDIIVAPNNCTDSTRETAQAHGAAIFAPAGPIASKGEVLTQLVDKLMAEGRHDAVCVFDADNLVHPDFLQKMNDARLAGVEVAQGFRDSKNPADSPVSTCYSVCYWMVNRFFNAGRERLGLSGLVNGCGFMVDMALLRRLGGWHTVTMTEDFEFSAQCVLAGERVHYVAPAVFYDEQPLTFRQSWKQRRRWSTGSVQGMQVYLVPLLKAAFTGRSGVCMDTALTFMLPLVSLASLVTGLFSAALGLWRLDLTHPGLLGVALSAGLALAAVAYLLASALAAFVIGTNRSEALAKTTRGVLFFALFLLSWMPISILSLFKQQTSWDPIGHSCAVSIGEL